MPGAREMVTGSTVEELLRQRRWGEVRQALEDWPAPDIADLMYGLEKPDRMLIFRFLPRDQSAEVFSSLDPKSRDDFLPDLSDEETRQLLADLKPDDRTDLLEELPGQMVQRLLNLLRPSDRREALNLLGYPQESVGRLMTPDYVAVRPSWTVERALWQIRAKGEDNETINVIYVTDASWELLDALELRKLILADPDESVERIMDYSFVGISAYDDRENAVQLIQRYDLDALPVVDSRGILLGIVTVDDVMDVAEEEVTEDFHKTAAVTPLKLSYRDTGMWDLFRRRIPWLLILVLLSLFSSGIISAYESTLASALTLAFFLPLLIDSGGNAGSQSATIIVRALAIGEIVPRQWLGALVKEVGVGILLGSAMGVAAAAVGFFRGDWRIGVVVGLSMILIVLVANIVGALLPLGLTKMRLDPATASSPLITTVIDSLGLLIYFSIAGWILHIL
jgi:magnesium transporter